MRANDMHRVKKKNVITGAGYAPHSYSASLVTQGFDRRVTQPRTVQVLYHRCPYAPAQPFTHIPSISLISVTE